MLEDSRGVAAFFEDIPTLIIVTVGISLFLISLVNTFSVYKQNQEVVEFSDFCRDFADKLRSYDKLVYTGWNQAGVFDKTKIENINIQNITDDFVIPHDFQIEIIDTSSYPQHYNKTLKTGDIPAQIYQKAVIYSSINIWVSDGEVHSGRMVVTIWR